tara:strand:+ start:828 stop:2903 length:2076 start_codon:yes stop_codon:yes gene_type:complete
MFSPIKVNNSDEKGRDLFANLPTRNRGGGFVKISTPEEAATNNAKLMDVFTGNLRETEETRALPELGEIGGGSFGDMPIANQAQIMSGLLLSFDEAAQQDIIRDADPDVIFKTDNNGNTFVKFGNGQESILNKAGFSGQDAKRLTTTALSFLPAGRAAKLATGLAKRLGLAGGANALTDLGVQGATQLLGSEQDINPIQTAVAGVAGTAGELIMPVGRGIKAARQSFKGDPLPPGPAADIIAAGEKANVPVLTSDVFPPEDIVGKLTEGFIEKIPFAGTGGVRAAQQKAREESIPAMALNFGVNLDTPVEQAIVKSLNDVQKGAIASAAKYRNDAITGLNRFGEISGKGLDDLISSVSNQVDELTSLSSTGDPKTLAFLNDVGSDLIGANFGKMAKVRTNVIEQLEAIAKNDFTNLPSRAAGRLKKLKASIDDIMGDFAKNNDEAAFQSWRKGNRLFADEFGKARSTALKKIFKDGNATPEAVFPILNGGKRSSLKTLYFNLDDTGKANARGAIVQKALQEGFKDASNVATDIFNPSKFLSFLKRENTRKAVQVFFRGDKDTVLNGFAKLLQATQQAQKAAVATPTGQSLLLPAGVGGGFAALKTATFLKLAAGLGGIGVAGRIFQSQAIRDVLVRLNASPVGSSAYDRALRKAIPLINSAIQTANKSSQGSLEVGQNANPSPEGRDLFAN